MIEYIWLGIAVSGFSLVASHLGHLLGKPGTARCLALLSLIVSLFSFPITLLLLFAKWMEFVGDNVWSGVVSISVCFAAVIVILALDIGILIKFRRSNGGARTSNP